MRPGPSCAKGSENAKLLTPRTEWSPRASAILIAHSQLGDTLKQRGSTDLILPGVAANLLRIRGDVASADEVVAALRG